MQVPEKLALIGGSILLSSTLIFTLKSQASSIIPSVGHSISHVFDHIGDAQKSSDFDNNLHSAQKNGWKTGTWGTAKYYIDNQHNMYVGKGELQTGATLRNTLGNSDTDKLKTLNIVQSVQAPQDSSNLFSTSDGANVNNSSLDQINGLENVDTSQVTTMFNMFTNDNQLREVNGINSWNVSKVTNMTWMFNNNPALQNINVAKWNVSNVSDAGFMFADDTGLSSLDLSGWDTTRLPNPNLQYGHGLCDMLRNSKIHSISLGTNTNVDISNLPSGTWKNGNTTLSNDQLFSSHPGTWVNNNQ